MGTNQKFKGRKKLNLKVKREFQSWMLRRVFVVVGISALIAACILYFYARAEVVGSFFEAHVKIRRVSELLLPVIAAGSAVSLVAGGLLALFLPQKIAGPIYRIEQELKKVASGDLTTRFTLRNGDTLQDFAADMSQTIESLRHTVDQAKQSLDALETALNDNRVEDARSFAAEARTALARLKTHKDA